MVQHETKVRVRYAEVDKMGYVYYGNFATYFEVARVEMLRHLGLTYKKMEEDGIILPVSEFSMQYKKPAFYDDEITVKTTVSVRPATRIYFDFETYNSDGELLNTAKVTLVFVRQATGRPCAPPENFNRIFDSYF